MNIEASITGKRQITIPKDLYESMGLKNTDKLIFTKNEKGEIIVSKKEINKLDVCPFCNREVNNKEIMVVENSQKYHMTCWNLSNQNHSDLIDNHCVANKITKAQKDTINEVFSVRNEYVLNETKKLKDNEVIVNMPVKLTFMENKPGIIGMVSNYDASKIICCNPIR